MLQTPTTSKTTAATRKAMRLITSRCATMKRLTSCGRTTGRQYARGCRLVKLLSRKCIKSLHVRRMVASHTKSFKRRCTTCTCMTSTIFLARRTMYRSSTVFSRQFRFDSSFLLALIWAFINTTKPERSIQQLWCALFLFAVFDPHISSTLSRVPLEHSRGDLKCRIPFSE